MASEPKKCTKCGLYPDPTGHYTRGCQCDSPWRTLEAQVSIKIEEMREQVEKFGEVPTNLVTQWASDLAQALDEHEERKKEIPPVAVVRPPYEIDTWGHVLLCCEKCGGPPDEINHGHTVRCLNCGHTVGRDKWPDHKKGTYVFEQQLRMPEDPTVNSALEELYDEVDALPNFAKRRIIAKVILLAGEIAQMQRENPAKED